ncbi:exopolyphosphatase, partial [bacterium]|nr:exopolyphosphatase [bacterium]
MSARLASAQHLARAVFASEIGHLRHVALLSEKLFRVFQPLHGLGDDALELLCCAAWLHDVGITVDPQGHHKHSL